VIRTRLYLGVGAMAAAQTAVYVARPMTSYRLLGLGGDAGDVGLVTAAFALLPLFLAIPLGRFADRRHSGPLLVAGCALQALACALLGSVASIGAIAAANALLGLGHLGLALGVQHVIARETDADEHDRRFAALAAGVSAGQLLGPLVAGVLVSDRQGAALTRASGHAMLAAAAIALLATAFAMGATVGRRGGRPVPELQAGGRLIEIVSIRGVPAGIFASIAVLSSADVLTACSASGAASTPGSSACCSRYGRPPRSSRASGSSHLSGLRAAPA
jgi:MFS family permease